MFVDNACSNACACPLDLIQVTVTVTSAHPFSSAPNTAIDITGLRPHRAGVIKALKKHHAHCTPEVLQQELDMIDFMYYDELHHRHVTGLSKASRVCDPSCIAAYWIYCLQQWSQELLPYASMLCLMAKRRWEWAEQHDRLSQTYYWDLLPKDRRSWKRYQTVHRPFQAPWHDVNDPRTQGTSPRSSIEVVHADYMEQCRRYNQGLLWPTLETTALLLDSLVLHIVLPYLADDMDPFFLASHKLCVFSPALDAPPFMRR